MRFARTGLAALAAAACLSAASPALAARAVCTVKDSAGRYYREQTSGLFDFQAKVIARALARADCHDKSKHPHSCKVAICIVTTK